MILFCITNPHPKKLKDTNLPLGSVPGVLPSTRN